MSRRPAPRPRVTFEPRDRDTMTPRARTRARGSRSPIDREQAVMRPTPGEFGVIAVLAAGLGVYAIASGVAADRQPLVVVGSVSFALVLVGILLPVAMLRGLTVRVDAPRDVHVGDPVPFTVAVGGRRRAQVEVRLLEPGTAWRRAVLPSEGTITRVAPRRGLVRSVRVEVRSSAPFGVFLRRRIVTAALPAPMYIAPAPARVRWTPEAVPADGTHVRSGAAGAGDAVRAVRPYVPGDAARLVHWPSTARQGSLVVREFEPPPQVGLAIVCDLTGPFGEAEARAQVAAGLGRAVLRSGGRCVVCCHSADGPVARPVQTVHELDRVLATATAGPPGLPPAGWPTRRAEAQASAPGA